LIIDLEIDYTGMLLVWTAQAPNAACSANELRFIPSDIKRVKKTMQLSTGFAIFFPSLTVF